MTYLLILPAGVSVLREDDKEIVLADDCCIEWDVSRRIDGSFEYPIGDHRYIVDAGSCFFIGVDPTGIEAPIISMPDFL